MDDNTLQPMNDDKFVEGGEHGWVGKPVVAYTIVFQEEEELKRFYDFIKLCRKEYPHVRTIGERIDHYIKNKILNAD
jgi:hypothetical protein